MKFPPVQVHMDRTRIAPVIGLLATAVACSAAPAKRPSPGATLFSSENIPTFHIQIEPPEFEQLRRSNRTYVRATVTVDGRIFRDVGVRLKGHGSFRPLTDKPSLTLNFDKFVSGQKLDGLTKILLNNAAQDTSLLSEYVAAGMFYDARVPVARVTHARVQLNSRDLGLYVLAEGMNKVFLKHHFKDAKGNLYDVNAQDIDQRLVQSSGVPGDQSDVAALVTAARLPPERRAKVLPELLDVDCFLSFLAVSVLGAQHDSYPLNKNNYRLYHDPASKRFVMMPHGIDGSFSRVTMPIRLFPNYVLTKAIAETPEFERAYRERVGELFTNVFKLDVLTNRIHEGARRLQNAASNESERASIAMRAASFSRRVAQRHENVANQLAGVDMTPMALSSGVTLRLTNWTSEINRGAANFRQIETEGRRALHISSAVGDNVASWRMRMMIAPGSYRFRASVRCQPPSDALVGAADGATIRISGRAMRPRVAADWTAFEFPFVVRPGEEDVQFVCECRGSAMQAWFNLDSLVLRAE